MQIARTVEEMCQITAQLKKEQKTIGYVPTMGALHAGHISLVNRAREECDFVVASVFVNPIQFAPNEDYEKYPRMEADDLKNLEEARCDAVFMPTPEDMYPPGFCTWVSVKGSPADRLEGLLRPGHFQGVATVVLKFIDIIGPDKVYFGQKDFQQVLVVKRMVEDLNVQTEIVRCPIVRESDGLAISSRNRYLSEEERKSALCLSKALTCAKQRFEQGLFNAMQIEEEMRQIIEGVANSDINYVVLVDGSNLQPVPTYKIIKPEFWVGRELVALVSARIGSTLLIDNCILNQQ